MSEKNIILKPTNDYVFKRIFGKVGNEDITRSLIKATTGINFKEIELDQTPMLEKDLLENKMGILDVRVIANKNNNIDIEMQVAKSEYVADRIIWYWAKLYSESIKSGESYDNTKRAICILIADFTLEKLNEIEEYHTKWNIREEKYSNIILTDKLELHIIELEKLEKMKNLYGKEKELLAWCKFIKNPEDMEDWIMSENENIKKAKEELDKISQDKHERWLAEMREKAIKDEIALRKTGYNEGIEEGIKRGMEEGIKKGLEEGVKKGSNDEKIEIAKNMLKENIEIDTIIKVTKLTKEEIAKLK
jgi:predicted transposase/invertase (TIGR01784 family)